MNYKIEENYLRDALKYSSKRREFLIESYEKLLNELSITHVDFHQIYSSVEYLHCSVSIIDDIQDGDDYRNGFPAYFMRNGYGTAVFASLNLWQKSIELFYKHFDFGQLLTHLSKLINSQEADIGLRPRPNNISPMQWYSNFCSIKIAEEIDLISSLCLTGVRLEENWLLKDFRNLLYSLGSLIQFIDDTNDHAQPRINSLKTNSKAILNYHLRLALYTEYVNSDIEIFVGKEITPEILKKLTQINSDSLIKHELFKFVKERREDIENKISNLPSPYKKYGLSIYNSIISNDYWTNFVGTQNEVV